MKLKTVEYLSVAVIAVVGIIHLVTMRGQYDEAHYMGMLFAANFAGGILAAIGIYRGSIWGWLLGILVAAGALLGYVASRTVGLPGMEVESWLQPMGILSVIAEAAFLALVVQARPWKALE